MSGMMKNFSANAQDLLIEASVAEIERLRAVNRNLVEAAKIMLAAANVMMPQSNKVGGFCSAVGMLEKAIAAAEVGAL